jgi:uncharacterized protein YlxP (DUF503 family)
MFYNKANVSLKEKTVRINMHILAMEISLYIPYAHSLKDKRRVRQSLMAKLSKHFSLSVRESDMQELSQKLVLSAALVCLTPGEGENEVQKIQDYLYQFTLEESCEVQDFLWDMIDVFH